MQGGWLALEAGWAMNLGGGFHHCSAERGGGFCAYADISLVINFLLLQCRIKSALIVDLDAHQGNGHERDFRDDPRVYIMDMFNAGIYPGDTAAAAAINRPVRLRHHTDSHAYLKLLRHHVPLAFQEVTLPYLQSPSPPLVSPFSRQSPTSWSTTRGRTASSGIPSAISTSRPRFPHSGRG